MRAGVRWIARAEILGRPAPFVSTGAGLTADTSSFTSLRQSPDALGGRLFATAAEARGRTGSGRSGLPRNEVKEEGQAAGQRRGTWAQRRAPLARSPTKLSPEQTFANILNGPRADLGGIRFMRPGSGERRGESLT